MGAPYLSEAGTAPVGAAADESFWREYHRRRSMNHVALMLAGRAVQAALDAGEPVDAATRRRLRAALADGESLQQALHEHVRRRCADVAA
jgi:hypothetical protein